MRRSNRSKARQSGEAGRTRGLRVAGELLRSLRLARKWTQSAAAARADISDRLIRKPESGGPIDRQSIELLAQLYRTPDNDLTARDLLVKPIQEPGGKSAGRERLMRRWFQEVWNQGRLETIDEITASGCVFHAAGLELHGAAEIRRRTEAIRAGFRDFDAHVESIIVHRDVVASRWRMAMTNDSADLAPPNKRIVVYGSTWMRIEIGRLAECWEFWEHAAVASHAQSEAELPSKTGRAPRKRR